MATQRSGLWDVRSAKNIPSSRPRARAGSPINPVAAGGATPQASETGLAQGCPPLWYSSSSGVRRCHWLAPGAPRRRRSLLVSAPAGHSMVRTPAASETRRSTSRRHPVENARDAIVAPLLFLFLSVPFDVWTVPFPLGSGTQWLCFLTQRRRMRTLYGLTETIHGQHGKLGGLDPSFMP